MKKTILAFAILLAGLSGFSQQIYLMNNVAATASGNYSAQLPKSTTGGATIQIITSADFDGTTTTDTLEVSADGVHWSYDVTNDGTTIMRHTISTPTSPSHTYNYKILSARWPYYRDVYGKGNATKGTITMIITPN